MEFYPPSGVWRPWKGKRVSPGFDGELLRDKSGLVWTLEGFSQEV